LKCDPEQSDDYTKGSPVSAGRPAEE